MRQEVHTGDYDCLYNTFLEYLLALKLSFSSDNVVKLVKLRDFINLVKVSK